MRHLVIFASLVLLLAKTTPATAADPEPPVRPQQPILKSGDTIALLGGEDMVVAAELGHLEALLHLAHPAHRLRIRCLAWEGDTVFEQPRQLNYPSLETQLEQIGATVLICQFGKAESLAGADKIPDFTTAYEKLLARLSAGGKRRIVVTPPFAPAALHGNASHQSVTASFPRTQQILTYTDAAEKSARAVGATFIPLAPLIAVGAGEKEPNPGNARIPLPMNPNASTEAQHLANAMAIADTYAPHATPAQKRDRAAGDSANQALIPLISAKNRLWHHYYRPQNWAFLAGDRTNQPSSRDHRDLSKRWFPEEMQQWLPLIEAKEREIWDMAAKLAGDHKAK